MRIYLIGMMGSGKSTVGKKLANRLSYKFYDLDDLIEEKIVMPIADFFEREGERRFRLIEQETLRETFNFSNTVISTGGGTPCFFQNIDEINSAGVSCYLQAEVGVLFNRLKGAIEQRPLLKNLGSEDRIQEYLTNLLKEREFYYLKAQKVIPALNVTAKIILEAINI